MQKYILEQAALHPALMPQDVIKLCYQAAFGAEHALGDVSSARQYLHEEFSALAGDENEALLENISDAFCRVNLRAWKAKGYAEEWLLQLFACCAAQSEGEERFMASLHDVDALCAAGKLPFSAPQWQSEKQAYLQAGVRAVHHSNAYRAAERPAYRLVSRRMARILPLLGALRPAAHPFVIALDGRCASGKTTLARDFAFVTGAGIVHMDDFFLPAALRTPERLAAPGGNVHYERVCSDVLPHLRQRADFAYTVFDCFTMTFAEERPVRGGELYIVEGAYSCHPALGAYMDARVFCDIAPDVQKERILRRNGPQMLENYQARWIPMEEAYIAACKVRENADILL